jgi:hypothetical protein
MDGLRMMRRRVIPGRRSGAGTPSAPTGSVVFDSTFNLVFDGNSLVAGVGGAQNLTRCLAMIAPIANSTSVGFLPAPTVVSGSPPLKYRSSKGILVSNYGVSGQTWRQMDGLDGQPSSDIDGAFDTTAGIQNYLGTWEITNTVAGSSKRTFSECIQYMQDYTAHRRAANPWKKIFTGTALPRMNSSTDQSIVDADNAVIDQVNAYLLANYQAMGFDAVFDVRKVGTYFDMQGDYSIAHFNAMAAASDTFWTSEGSTHVHLNSNGYWYIATQFVVPMLQAL